MRYRLASSFASALVLSLCLANAAQAILRVEPRLTLRGEYDTNVISLGYEGVDGVIFIISPSLGLQGEVLRTNFMVDLGIDVWRYRDLDPNDGVDLTIFNDEVPFVKASVGRLLLTRLGVEVGAGYRKDLTMTHRFDTSNDLFRTPSEYYTGTLKLAWTATNRAKVQGGVTYDRVDYVEAQPVPNSVSMGYDLALSYRLSEKISAKAGFAHDVRDYDPDDRATRTGFNGQLGYRMNRSYSVEANGSLDRVDPGAGIDPETLWTAAILAKRESPKTLLQADLYRKRGQIREEGGIPQTDGLTLGIAYKPTQKLSFQSSGTVERIDYSEIPLVNAARKEDLLKVSVWVTYEAYKDIFVRGDYSYVHRDSNIDAYDYGNHQVGISLVGRLSFL
jgi:hypothetical protein